MGGVLRVFTHAPSVVVVRASLARVPARLLLSIKSTEKGLLHLALLHLAEA